MPQKGHLPADISSYPSGTYNNKGWLDWGDWLGTGTIATSLRKYRSFKSARAFARKLGLKSGAEWQAFSRGELKDRGTLPADIPATPHASYSGKGWSSWGDWLGTGRVAFYFQKYRSFAEAGKFARSLELKSTRDWLDFCAGKLTKKGNLPSDIPSNPHNTYAAKGWKGMGDWLGTGTVAPRLRVYRPFKEGRAFARSLGLKSRAEWEAFCKGDLKKRFKLPSDIPFAPHNTYAAEGWKGMGDWLGTGAVAPRLRVYRPFKGARAFARSLGLKSRAEWEAFCKGKLRANGSLPSDVPAHPERTYAGKGWCGVGDWLGTGTVATFLRKYRSFRDARAYVRNLGLTDVYAWYEFCKNKLPKDIPSNPQHTYSQKGWNGYRDWLGTDRKRKVKRRR
jgi:hypothetical protein